MKNTTKNTTTKKTTAARLTIAIATSEERAKLATIARVAFSTAQAIATSENATVKELTSANEAYAAALRNLNDNARGDAYARALQEPSPVTALCKMTYFARFAYRQGKNGEVTAIESAQRVNILDFVREIKAQEIEVSFDTEEVVTAMSAIATAVESSITSAITSEQAWSTKGIKKALDAFIRVTKMEGVHARSVDARFLCFACTKARKLGELAAINADSVAPFVMDMFHVQLRGLAYGFESVEPAKGEKPADESTHK